MGRHSIQFPRGNVFPRNLKREYPIISHGKGVFLFDEQGSEYLDASSGALVTSVGHANEAVVEKIHEQLKEVSYTNGMHFSSKPMESLAKKLARRAKPLELSRSAFLCSGSEAVEAGVKLARQICCERGQHKKTKIIARTPSYHGNTLFSLSLSGRQRHKAFFEPYLTETLTVSAPNQYHCPIENYSGEGAEYYGSELKKLIEENDPSTICAFIFEPIGGLSSSVQLPPSGYFEKVQEICKQYGILLIADEILTGVGRTGKFFACEHFNLKPDILMLGKGLNGGFVPLSAVLTRDDLAKEISTHSGSFLHGQTYMNIPITCATGLAVVEHLEEHKIIDTVEQKGTLLLQSLEKIKEHPHVGNVSGKGLLIGIEWVENKETKKPFDRSLKIAERFVEHAMTEGLIVWGNSGNIDGSLGDMTCIAPSLTIEEEEIKECVSRFESALNSFSFSQAQE